MKHPIGKWLVLACPLIIFIGGIPWYGESYDGCDALSMSKWNALKDAGVENPRVESGIMYVPASSLGGLAMGAELGGGDDWSDMGTVATSPVNIIAGLFQAAGGAAVAAGAAGAASAAAQAAVVVLQDEMAVLRDELETELSGSGTSITDTMTAKETEIAAQMGLMAEQGAVAGGAAAQAGGICAKLTGAIFGDVEMFKDMSCVSKEKLHPQLGVFGCVDTSQCMITNNVKGTGQFCEGPSMIGGFPSWTIPIFICFALGMLCNAGAWMTYQTADDETEEFAGQNDQKEAVAASATVTAAVVEGEKKQSGMTESIITTSV
jgi:hypothetical protein